MKYAFIPVLVVLSSGFVHASVNNVFDWTRLTVDPQYTAGVIAPFTGDCPPYNTCGGAGSVYWPQGFPVGNIFGAQVQTAEGTYDTIFQDGPFENVFFHMNDLQPINGTVHISVTGAQDGPSSTYRSFTYFNLISYTNVANPGGYTLLFSGAPTVTNGFESISADVNLANAGPYFVYQFGTTGSGPRIFGVEATATPEPGLYSLLGLGISGLAFFRRSKRNRTVEEE